MDLDLMREIRMAKGKPTHLDLMMATMMDSHLDLEKQRETKMDSNSETQMAMETN